ncbi:head GIN domain-containing protein [Pedobacter yulinensis]|nr:head GIN domain-containing protein [Pedobacter yulinensis]
MKNLFYGKLLGALALGLVSLQSVAQSRQVALKNYTGISVASGIDLYLRQGATETAVIEADRDISEQVLIEQQGESVTIRFKNGFSWKNVFNSKPVKVYASYKNLKAITASGGSDVFGQNAVKSASLYLKASGGSDLKLQVACSNLKVEVSGGSDADLSGKTTNMSLSASGGSDIDAFNLVSDYAQIRAAGGSDVNARVNKALEAGASGGSDVTFKGEATLKKTTSSHSGDVKRAK